ncbi:MAG: PmoA family protein [Armatimonadota bacterium]
MGVITGSITLVALVLLISTEASARGVTVEQKDDYVDVAINGRPFTHYVFRGAAKPYCWPIIGPTGKPVTRAYPMAQVEGEAHDHHHHRSLWFTFGEVNGIDFWAEAEKTGREVHREFKSLASGDEVGTIRELVDWVGPDGSKVCEDERELRFSGTRDRRVIDFDIVIRATEGPVEFGDTKEGMFGLRVAHTMKLKGGDGHIVNSRGDRDDDTWGKQGEWCDYYGSVNGDTVGIAIMDHPRSFRHPTYWHVRDYGLFAANPFGLRHFIGDEQGKGRYTIPKGESIEFHYRVLIHRGDAEEARVAALYDEYARQAVPTFR